MSKANMRLYFAYYGSPIGIIKICSDDTFIVSCSFVENKEIETEMPKILEKALKQIDEYFQKKRTSFDLLLAPKGTEFQQQVWLGLLKIQYGETISYKELASRISKENAIRAVGNANGKNPISIIIPCHRVIGSDGKLVGYGGGMERKLWLLNFEKEK